VKPPPPKVAPTTIDIGGAIGIGNRFGDSSYFDVTARAGLAFGVSAWIAPAPAFAIGIAYQHLGLGRERSDVGPYGVVDITRDAHLAWLGLRLYPLRGESAALFLEIAPGLVFQRATASGLVTDGGPNVTPTPLTCKASDSADFALRAGFGGELKLSENAVAMLGVSLDNYRLSSAPMDDCINGAGTVSEIIITAGFAYRLDITKIVR
jgi:hypothetical protein